MTNSNQTINVKDIVLLTSNNEIILSGTYYRDWMNYETQINIDATQLNLVINQLQKNNPDTEISEMFSSCITDAGKKMYYFETGSLQNTMLDVIVFMKNPDLRLIRA